MVELPLTLRGGIAIKKFILSILSILWIIILVGCSQQGESSNSWAYDFVKWKGESYVVTESEQVEKQDIGKPLGEVEIYLEQEQNETTKNSSNLFKEGTEYFMIKGINTSEAIAVRRENGDYIKAIHSSIWKENQQEK
ncbi:hypothetical protein Q7A53_10195 [Halobacillus rhizosphaerae]|uniref:hypothetical protein n=1 Tax=Halobacillus rhizosphaerae TaxID=3064889 RepID=UPI00398AD843